ncbi:Fur family transcriptional regulator [Ghiorsea bivora]|uniref:Fur family transcriptional regulator n=1 Tax=Ghiorsea bivora TaxID=1485545 RepID=UPI00056FF560|nr:transcriptional repressor [Ghiorsea bivora]
MQKLTAQRQAILDMINRSDKHWDADEVAYKLKEQGISIGIATVYRGLSALAEQGLIESIQLADKKRYERADKAHHDHLLCTNCGSIEEFCNPEIEALQDKVAEERGFHIQGHQLLLFGLCKACKVGER